VDIARWCKFGNFDSWVCWFIRKVLDCVSQGGVVRIKHFQNGTSLFNLR